MSNQTTEEMVDEITREWDEYYDSVSRQLSDMQYHCSILAARAVFSSARRSRYTMSDLDDPYVRSADAWLARDCCDADAKMKRIRARMEDLRNEREYRGRQVEREIEMLRAMNKLQDKLQAKQRVKESMQL
jgi:hypothetical protein